MMKASRTVEKKGRGKLPLSLSVPQGTRHEEQMHARSGARQKQAEAGLLAFPKKNRNTFGRN